MSASDQPTTIQYDEYYRHMADASCNGNYFTFRECFLDILSRDAALVLQKLINLLGFYRKKNPQQLQKDGWAFPYSVRQLKKSLRMSKDCQQRVLNELAGKNRDGEIISERVFVVVSKRGMPVKRYLYIDFLKLNRALEEKGQLNPRKKPLSGISRSPESGKYMSGKSRPMNSEISRPMKSGISRPHYIIDSPSENINNHRKNCPARSARRDGYYNHESTDKNNNSAAPPKGRGELFPDNDKYHRKQDERRARLLWDELTRKGLRDGKSKLASWIKEFAAIRDSDGRPDHEIEETLIEYLPLLSETMLDVRHGFIPVAYCAAAFRMKYVSIRARLAARRGAAAAALGHSKREYLYELAQQAVDGTCSISYNGRIKVKVAGGGWKWLAEGEEQDYDLPPDVTAYYYFLRGEYDPDAPFDQSESTEVRADPDDDI